MARWGRAFHQAPIVPRGITGERAPGYPPGEFLGLNIPAKNRDRKFQQRRTTILPPTITGAAIPPVSLPVYPGLVVLAPKRGRRLLVEKKQIVPRFRFTPSAGFPGPKTGFLNVRSLRSFNQFSIGPLRSGTLGVE